MAKEEDDIVREAIAGTEREIFSEAMEQDENHTDESGDRSVEEMGSGLEGDHEADDADVQAQGQGGDDEAGDGEGDTEGKSGQANRDPETGRYTKKADGEEGDESEGAEDQGDDEIVDQDQGRSREQTTQRVPVRELVSERKARQTAESALTELQKRFDDQGKAHKDELAAINGRLDTLLTNLAQGKIPGQGQQGSDQDAIATEDQELTDLLLSSPAGYAKRISQDISKTVLGELRNQRLEESFADAHDAHKEGFETAYKALTSLDKADPVARATVQRITASRNPGKALMDWHQQQQDRAALATETLAQRDARVAKEALESAANDPEFLKGIAQSLGLDPASIQVPAQRQRAAAGDGKGQNGARHVARMPKSLNSASGGGQSRAAGGYSSGSADRDVFNDVMSGT